MRAWMTKVLDFTFGMFMRNKKFLVGEDYSIKTFSFNFRSTKWKINFRSSKKYQRWEEPTSYPHPLLRQSSISRIIPTTSVQKSPQIITNHHKQYTKKYWQRDERPSWPPCLHHRLGTHQLRPIVTEKLSGHIMKRETRRNYSGSKKNIFIIVITSIVIQIIQDISFPFDFCPSYP